VRHKAILLASAASAALFAAQPAVAEGPYLSVSGGTTFIQDKDGEFEQFFRGSNTYGAHFDPDAGFLISTALGLELDHWLAGLKVEIEGSYRRNHVGGGWTRTETEVVIHALSSGPIDAHLSTFALMANAWYEFSIGSRFKPYFGGGIGWARSQVDGVFVEPTNVVQGLADTINPFEGFHVENSGFAYQLGAGITSQISPGVSLGLGYRFFDGPNNEFFFGSAIPSLTAAASSAGEGHVKFDNVEQSVILSLSIDVN
jgi:opacity protein-like surface antigen